MQVSTLQARLQGLSARERAIADVVARLSSGGGRTRDVEIHHLRTYGLRETEIHEVLEVAAVANQQRVDGATVADTAALPPYYFEGTVPPGV